MGSGGYHQQLIIAVCNFYTQCILYWVRAMYRTWAGLWSFQSITLTSSPYFRERGKRNLVPSLLCDIYSACKDHPTRGSLLCNDPNNPSHKTGLWFYPVREWRKWLPSVQVVGEKAKWENKNLPSLHLISCSAGFWQLWREAGEIGQFFIFKLFSLPSKLHKSSEW